MNRHIRPQSGRVSHKTSSIKPRSTQQRKISTKIRFSRGKTHASQRSVTHHSPASRAQSNKRCNFAKSSSENAFDFLDPLNISHLLTDEERMIQDAARAFSQEELAPVVKEWYRSESFDPKMMRKFGDAGLLGASLQGYGCAGASATAYGLIAREVERVDSGFRSAMSVQSSLVMYPIHTYASSDAIKNAYLPALAKGELIGAFGLTEPNHGSNPAGMETFAIQDDNGDYILNGTKTWITNSPHADILVVWAKDRSNNNEISGFIVDAHASGVETPTIHGKLSLRASTTGQIILDNVKVTKSHKLQVSGLRGPFSCLNSARMGIAWGVLGAAEFCIEQARDYVINRTQFDTPLSHKQLPQFKLANMVTELGLAQTAALQVTRLKEQHLDNPQMISLIKRNNCEKALTIARLARDMLGGNGISDEYHIMRHMVNLETVNTYEGTSDIHALILGRAITGSPAF